MFDPGFTELVLLFVIALFILGPQRLPRVASQIGKWVGRARRTVNQLRYQLEREVALEEMSRKSKGKPKPHGTETKAAPPDGASQEGAGAGPASGPTADSGGADAGGEEPRAPHRSTEGTTGAGSTEASAAEPTIGGRGGARGAAPTGATPGPGRADDERTDESTSA